MPNVVWVAYTVCGHLGLALEAGWCVLFYPRDMLHMQREFHRVKVEKETEE